MISTRMDSLTEHWWAPVVRGVAAIIFGVLLFARPALGLVALIALWGVYAFVDGGFNLASAAIAGRAGARWGWYLFEGLVSIAAGVIAFAYPGLTAVALLYLIAIWAILTGFFEIGAAIELRHVIKREWLLAVAGVLSIAFGLLLFAYPSSGALAIVWMIGAYAIAFGVLLVALGVKLHGFRTGREFPMGGTPSTT